MKLSNGNGDWAVLVLTYITGYIIYNALHIVGIYGQEFISNKLIR